MASSSANESPICWPSDMTLTRAVAPVVILAGLAHTPWHAWAERRYPLRVKAKM